MRPIFQYCEQIQCPMIWTLFFINKRKGECQYRFQKVDINMRFGDGGGLQRFWKDEHVDQDAISAS